MWPNLLISTTFNLYLFYNDKFYSILDRKFDDRYYGITWSKDCLYFGTESRIYKTDRDFNITKIKDYERHQDLHQILFHEDRLYVTNTLQNTIDVIDEVEEKIERKKWMEKEEDIEHINSICFYDKKFYVCCHNKGVSSIRLFDESFQPVGIMPAVGHMNHNIIIEDGFLYTLNSYSCEIVQIALSSANSVKAINLKDVSMGHYFLRGLEKVNSRFIIGLTCNRSASGMRDSNPSWIHMYDENMEELDKKTLPQCGQIRDIRAIDSGFSHNGIAFPLDVENLLDVKGLMRN